MIEEACIDRVFEIDDLVELENYLNRVGDRDCVREMLYRRFMGYANYSTAMEWNRAVRLCECLAITGWGEHEGVEAMAYTFANGSPCSLFVTTDRQSRYLDAMWRQKDGGMIIDVARSRLSMMDGCEIRAEVCEKTKLQSQRNWLPKTPILVYRALGNCYSSSRAVVESLDTQLNPLLEREMRPEVYGNVINRISINCSMSFDDNEHCRSNYVIADEGLRKGEYEAALLSMYTPEEISRNWYYMCPRYEIGPFRKKSGRAEIRISFEKEFSLMPPGEQKRIMGEYILEGVKRFAMRQKKLDYDFESMIEDLGRAVDRWTGMEASDE